MMKNLLIITLLLSIFSFGARAQVTINLNPSMASAEVGQVVTISVEATGMTNIAGFQIGLHWDSAIIKTQNSAAPITNVNTQFGGSWQVSQQSGGQTVDDTLSFVWFDQNAKNFTGVLFEIPFVVQAVGTSPLTFSGMEEVIDGGFTVLTVVSNDATVTGTTSAANPLKLSISSVSANSGATACTEVAVVSDFTDITKLDFSLEWNNTIAGFSNTMALNTALSSASFNTSQTGKLGFQFNAATGVNLSAGDVLFSSCYVANGAEGTATSVNFGETPVTTVVENSTGAIAHTFNNGNFAVNTSGPPADTIFLHFNPITTSAEVGSTINIALEIEGTKPVAGVQLGFEWNKNIIHTLNSASPVTNVNSIFNTGFGFGANQEVNGVVQEDTLAATWLDNVDHNLSGVLFEIPFVVQSVGSTDLLITGTEFLMASTDEYVVVFDTATITGIPATVASPLKLSVDVVTADMGATQCADVKVVSDFADITKLDFSLDWDNSIAGFNSTMSLNSALSTGTFNTTQTGKLGFSFNSGTGVNLSTGDVLFSVCYVANGAAASSTPISFSGTPTAIDVENSAGNIGNNFTNGSFTINNSGGAIILTIPDVTGANGTNVCVPVVANNFTDMTSVSFSLGWDTNILTYTGATLFNDPVSGNPIGALNESNTANGELGYLHFVIFGSPVTLPNNSTIVDVCFNVIGTAGQMSPITFINMPVDYSSANSDGNVVLDTTSGSLTIPSNQTPIVINGSVTPLPCGVTTGGAIQLAPTGGTGSYTYAWTGPGGAYSSQNLTGLGAGTYSVTVTSGAETATETFTLTEIGFTLSLVSLKNEAAPPGGNGSIEVAPSGGSTYAYAWSGPGSPFGNASTINNLSAGSYSVVATDANSCTASMTLEIKKLEVSGSFENPKCNAGNDGTISLSVTGGTMPYAYQWNMGPGGSAPTGLVAGNYVVTVSDATNANVVLTFDLVNPPSINVQLDGIVNEDAGMSNGGVNITATGGTGSLTYLWSNNTTNEDLAGVTAGAYSVTVTDVNGCTTVGGPYNVIVSGAPEAVISVEAVKCNGESSGSITISSISGGTAPYTVTGIGSAQSSLPITYSMLTAGSYDLVITDANMVTTNVTVVVVQPDILLIDGISITPSNGSDGAISYNVTGGNSPYTFDWSDNTLDGTQNPSNLASGMYSVTVTDAKGCVVSQSFTVPTAGGGTIVPVYSVQNINCSGEATGSITISNITGGVAPYTVTGIDGAETNLPIVYSMLVAGSYNLVVTDANGFTAAITTTITEPTPMVISNINITPSTGLNGIITYDLAGGTPNYTFDWDHDNWDGLEDIFGLPAEDFTVTITDANGCTLVETFTVTNATQPVATSSASDVNCNGEENGSITISAINGGTSPYTVTGIGSPQSDLPIVYSSLAAGTYNLTVTDANGLTSMFSEQINEPTAINVNNIVVEASTGFNGSISYNVSGGTPNYTFDWDHNDLDGTQNATGLAPGDYVVTISDANGCTLIQSFTVAEGSAPEGVVSTQAANCFGGGDGQITVSSVTGGTPNYTISIDGLTPQTTDGTQPTVFTGLISGAYTVTIVDAIGANKTYVVTVEQPEQIQIVVQSVISEVLPAGNNGSIDVAVSGGVSPYTYNWTPTSATTEDLSGLAAGTYSLLVMDANFCQMNSTQIVVSQESNDFTCSTIAIDTDCPESNNGSVKLNIMGGAFPLTTVWKKDNAQDTFATTFNLANVGAGTYQVTVKDANGAISTCSATVNQLSSMTASLATQSSYNGYGVSGFGVQDGKAEAMPSMGVAPYQYLWSSNETTAIATGLAGGTISVTITDDVGCTKVLTDNLTEPDGMTCSTNVTDTPCEGAFDGAISLTANGGVTAMNYIYSWAGPNGFNSNSKDVINVGSGAYFVTITDANGNSTSCNATVGVASNMVLGIEHISNYNGYDLPNPDDLVGEAKADVTGGVAPYDYEWSNGSTEQQPDNLPAGTVSVTVTDNLGCTKIASTVLTAPGAFFCNVETTSTICPDVPEGSATVILSGGVMPISSYFWTGPDNPPADSMLINLSQGTYDITVTDANGVSTSCSGIVDLESNLSANVQIETIATTETSTDGKATVLPVGGVEPYQILWSTTETGESATMIPGGSATVTVTDAKGCTTTIEFVMPIVGQLVASFSTEDISCFGLCDGTASITIAGGSAPYTYNWDGGQKEKSVDGLCAGEVGVTVTDVTGLAQGFSVVLNEPDSLHVEFELTNPSSGSSDGSIITTVSGGTPDYSYNWNDGSSQANLSGKGAGTYILMVSDENSCSKMVTVTLQNGISDDCFQAPKVITPDVLDGSYDNFDITCIQMSTENDLSIYSRWGQLVYHQKEYSGDWRGVDDSGSNLPAGAYFWVLKYKINGENLEKKGHVTIIR